MNAMHAKHARQSPALQPAQRKLPVRSRRPQQPGARPRGAALLAAMLTVTLVATLAATALWQQWRAVEVETAERARVQAAWIMLGALDWSRLILRQDASSGGADHLGEPWAMPLQEARLSSFLAGEGNAAPPEDASTDLSDAFLSGQILDLQGRLNLSNLVLGGKVQETALHQFERLFANLGLPAAELDLLVQALLQTQAPANAESDAPLLPPSVAQLGWLGLAPATVAALAPYVVLLPLQTPVNLNTAPAEVLQAAIEGIDRADAQRLVQARAGRHFSNLNQVRDLLGPKAVVSDSLHSVASAFFEARGQLRLGEIVVGQRSLLYRQGVNVRTLWSERGAFPLVADAAGAADTVSP